MKWNIFLAGLLSLLMTSCITIEIRERDIFDVKRTIGPEDFSNSPYHLEEVTIISGDQITLDGWFISHPAPLGTVLFLGGNGFLKETSEQIIRSIVDQRMNLLVFNYRGYGRNPGIPTVSGLKADGMAAYNYLVDHRGISPNRLVIHGHSLGTLIGGYMADQKPMAGLVLESPITDMRFYTDKMLPALVRPFIRFDVESTLMIDSNLDRLSRLSIPLLIMVGKDDRITPPAMARKLYHTAPSYSKTIKILKKGGHNDLPERKDYRAAIAEFYSKSVT